GTADAMANRHPAAWRPRDETYHPHVKAAKNQGYGVPVYWTGIETPERATEIKRGLHRAGRHLRESVRVDLTDADDGTITLVFTLYSRQQARAYIKQAGRWNGS